MGRSVYEGYPGNTSAAIVAERINRDVLRRLGIEEIRGSFREAVLLLIASKFMKYDGDMEGADHDDFIRAEWAAGAMRQLALEVHALPGDGE